MTDLTIKRLRAALSYDPETGAFTWLSAVKRGRWNGKAAGTLRPRDGYIQVQLDGRNYLAHRLAWFWMTGLWPPDEVDHRDLDKKNNRWANLRAATRSQNMANKALTRRNKTGFKGVHIRANGYFGANIRRGGKTVYLGYFRTKAEAHAAFSAAAKTIHGEFARV